MMSHLPPNSNTIPMLMGSGLPPHSLQLSHLPPNHSLGTPQTSAAIAQVPSTISIFISFIKTSRYNYGCYK